ncbi:MAG: hypothetical protein KKA42_11035 [candidate division Zixibacteria bacterium]|nr:hypothetical protein [candidate division Zixibacteria bacterium]
MNTSTSTRPFAVNSGWLTVAALVLCLIAAAPPVEAGRHVISSLPYTFDAGDHSGDAVDTLVLGSSKLSSATGGITLSALYNDRLHGVLLDLGNDTISFGEGGGSGNTGLRISGTNAYWPYDIEVRGGHILHNSPSGTANSNECISIQGNDLLIKDVHAEVMGYNGTVIDGGGPYTYNVEIDGGLFRNNTTHYDSRCNYDACVFKLDNNYSSTLIDFGASLHWRIHDVVIDGGPHVGIFLAGREGHGDYVVAEVYACSVMTDARNEMYPSYDGTCHSSSNPYGITLRHSDAGTKIYNNVVTSGTTYGGNRGILFEYARGSAANPILVYGNYVNVHEGPNVEYGDALPSHGLRIRYSPQEMRIYDNTFICVGDNNPATDDYGTGVHPVRLSTNSSATNVILRNNTIKAQSLSSSGVNAYGVTFDGIDYPNTYYLEYNNITSAGTIYKIGESGTQDIGPTGVSIIGDTVAFESITIDPQTYGLGHLGNPWICTQNTACDVVYQGGTSDTDINFASGGVADIKLMKTIGIRVVGENDEPVPGAVVTVTNNYGHVILNETTPSSGLVSGPVAYRFEARTTTDSTNYNGFTIRATKGSDTKQTSITVGPDAGTTTLKLDNTTGEVDVIAPDAVDDLSAVTGVDEGTIILTWTAPGEDGSVGTAASYEIKYSTGTISEGNFDAATTFCCPPTPVSAGTMQSTTLFGLTPGQVYFVALKTTDHSDNESPISNVVSAEAKTSISTGEDDDEIALVSPGTDAPVKSSHPTLIVANINATSTNEYHFEVAEDSSFALLTSASPVVLQQEGATTAWQVTEKLVTGETYFWRARANDDPYSAVSWFSVAPETHAYPNPFRPAVHGTATFAEVPADATLMLTTLNGHMVRQWVHTSGSDLTWDGTNLSGSPVASGTYLWYLDGTETKGKLIVVR